jgi:NAD(P)H-quinone oxidoreductase subunit I
MKLAALFQDAVRALFQRPVTQRYPIERRPSPQRLRGALHWQPEKCSGCCLCSKDCPSNAIELITLDKAAKRFVLRYDLGRCTYCAQCVQSCRFGCIGMAADQWELASGSKVPFTIYYGNEADVHALMERLAGSNHQVTSER